MKVAAPGLSSVNVSEKLAVFYAEHLAQSLTLAGVRVITAQEIATLLGFERQKQLAGCADESKACITELGNALGVDGLLLGSVAKFGETYQLNLRILAPMDGRPLSIYSGRAQGDHDMLDALALAAKSLAAGVHAKLGRAAPRAAPAPAATVSRGTALRTWSWVPLAGGGVAVAASVVLFLRAKGSADELTGPLSSQLPPERAQQLRDAGAAQQTVGLVLLGTGAALLAAGGAMRLFGAGPAQPAVALSPSGSGAWLGVTGVLP